MYTQSEYVRKASSTALLAVLLLSALIALIPIAPVFGSTGNVVLGVANSDTAPTTFTAAVNFVNVSAGTDHATNDCTLAPCALANFFAINFNSVTFSGSQFALYLSKDGLSQISAGDVKYAGLFSVSDLLGTGVIKTMTNGTFWIGTTSGNNLIVGPIPTKISNDYAYVKVFDGSTTSVAANIHQLGILPGITLSPACTASPYCAAGTLVAVSGGGFPANKVIDLNYSYTFYAWSGAPSAKAGAWITGIATGSGWFSKTSPMLDTKQAENPSGVGISYTPITIFAVNSTAPHTTTGLTSATTQFNEAPRVFVNVASYKPDGSLDTSQHGPFGNDTGSTLIYPDLSQPINSYPTGSLGIVGNFSMLGASVTVWIDGSQVGSGTANGITGAYTVNVTVPALALGTHTVTVKDDAVPYTFTINIVPTLVLTPSHGPVGALVLASAYGFPSNTKTSLYWFEHVYGDGLNFFLLNATVGPNGTFNVTASAATFVVPHSYGGGHDVTASNTYLGVNTTSIPGPDVIAFATFTVTPTLNVTPNTISNDGSMVNATGTGFIPWELNYDQGHYTVNIDNAAFNPAPNGDDVDYAGMVNPAANGDITISFVASGFRPGMHVISLYNHPTNYYSPEGVYVPAASATFNVTTAGDPIGKQIAPLAAAVNSFSSSLSNIQTTLNSVQSSVNTLSTSVSGLSTSLSSLTSSVSSISSTVNDIKTAVDSISTAIGSSNVSSQLTSISSALTSIQSDLSTVKSNTQGLASVSGQVSDTLSAVNTSQTYVLVVAVLAAITLVLALAILIRKLS